MVGHQAHSDAIGRIFRDLHSDKAQIGSKFGAEFLARAWRSDVDLVQQRSLTVLGRLFLADLAADCTLAYLVRELESLAHWTDCRLQINDVPIHNYRLRLMLCHQNSPDNRLEKVLPHWFQNRFSKLQIRQHSFFSTFQLESIISPFGPLQHHRFSQRRMFRQETQDLQCFIH